MLLGFIDPTLADPRRLFRTSLKGAKGQMAPRVVWLQGQERDFFIDNLLVRIRLFIEMIWWTGLASWDFEFPFPGGLASTFLGMRLVSSRAVPLHLPRGLNLRVYRGTSLIRSSAPPQDRHRSLGTILL